ncbi:hypothetical protein [Nocardioides sp.]|uniref:hypothetical protein n=1 Tax=Nocardioides sp. TaxID=35761 RepID=UPI002ED904FA
MSDDSPLSELPLDGLVAGILKRIRLSPPEMDARLRPPQLRVTQGPDGVNSYCVRAGGQTLLLVGRQQFALLEHYARVAATYFLPTHEAGARPSANWEAARAALATTVDWLATPVAEPRFPSFVMTPRQTEVAHAMAMYAFRFVLCHELAHVALEHVEDGPHDAIERQGALHERLKAAQERELVADQIGMKLHVGSLLPALRDEAAFASCMYALHALALLDLRLMVLAQLVDHEAWSIELTHPPTLSRHATLAHAGGGLNRVLTQGLLVLHRDLECMDAELREMVMAQQAEVAGDASALIAAEAAAATEHMAGCECVAPTIATEFQKLLDRSPTGVLLALESTAASEWNGPGHWAAERLATTLPLAFREFLALDRADRARHLTRQR